MTKTPSVVLKACPSCGAEAKTVHTLEGCSDYGYGEYVWYVRCKYCSFMCGGFQVRSNAIKRWNIRYKETKS